MDSLRGAVDPPRPMEIAANVEQRQFHASDFGEAGLRFQLCEPLGTVRLGKGGGRLIQKLDSLPTDSDFRQLPWANDLKDHRRLVC